jgi:hypothetical protein
MAEDRDACSRDDARQASADGRYTRESLLAERRALRDIVEYWWQRWSDLLREEGFEGDPGDGLPPLDEWAQEAAAEAAAAARLSSEPAPSA